MRGFSDGGFCLARSLSLASQGKTRLLVAGWWWWWWSYPCAARSLSLVALLGGGRRSGRPARSLSLARAASARRQYVFMVGGGGGGVCRCGLMLARCRSLATCGHFARLACSLSLAAQGGQNPQARPRRGGADIFFLAVCFFFVFLPHEMAGNITFSRGSFDSHFAECQEFSNPKT